MKLIKENLQEAVGVKGKEWDLLNRVFDELNKSSDNRELVKEFNDFLTTTYDKQVLTRQKTWELIKSKRQANPNYGRPKSEWRKHGTN